MKLLLVSALPPPEGGVAAWTKVFLEYCGNKGVPVEMVDISLNGARRERINAGMSIRDELSRTRRVLRDMRVKLKSFKPDIVHVNTSCGPFGIFRDSMLVSAAKRSGAKVVLHFHCSVGDRVKGSLRTSALKRMVKKADRALVLNSASADHIETVCGKKPVSVPNFIDPKLLFDGRTAAESVSEALFVGHVQRTKGCMEIFEAARSFPGITFTLIGPVSDEAASADRPENVVLTGPMPHEKVVERMKKADVFLFPSYSEGFSLSLTEAMASGLPCAASDVGANREMLEDCGGVILAEVSANAVREALRRLSDPAVRQSVSDRSIKKVRENYLPERAAGRIFAEYESLIGGMPPEGAES